MTRRTTALLIAIVVIALVLGRHYHQVLRLHPGLNRDHVLPVASHPH